MENQEYRCPDGTAIEDFEFICDDIDSGILKNNFEFICEHVPELLDTYASLIDFVNYTSMSVAEIDRLRKQRKYADYLLPITTLYIIGPHIFGSYVNIMLGLPQYALYSYRIVAEALAGAAYIDIVLDGKGYKEKVESDEYKYFNLCSAKRTRPKAVKVLGKKLVERTCSFLDEIASYWIHPIAGYGRTSPREPAGQLYAITLHKLVTGAIPSYIHPPPIVYSKEDILLLKYIAKLAQELDKILIDIYIIWHNEFNIGPRPHLSNTKYNDV